MNEYAATNGTLANWGTRIVNFSLTGVVPPPGVIPPDGNDGIIPFAGDAPETSDRAASLGVILPGPQSLPTLSINRSLFGLPDHDWYWFTPQRRGTIVVNPTVTSGQPLFFSLFRRVGSALALVGRTAIGPGQPAGLAVAVGVGEQLYLEVTGVTLAPGVRGQGNYRVAITLV